MAGPSDVRRLALALPEAAEEEGRFAFFVCHRSKRKAFAWVWMERVGPRAPRVPNPDVLAVRVASLDEKEALLAAAPEKFFTEPHYNGYPAVLVRLAAVTVDELADLLEQAWRRQAPRALVKERDRRE